MFYRFNCNVMLDTGRLASKSDSCHLSTSTRNQSLVAIQSQAGIDWEIMIQQFGFLQRVANAGVNGSLAPATAARGV